MINDSKQIAVFIDYDNIEISYDSLTKDKNVQVEWVRILEEAAQIGRVVYRRSYADWSIYADRQRELLGLGIDLIHVSSRRGKNAADIRIVIDALELMHNTNNLNLTHVMLVSGDGDFTELVHRLRQEGITVIGMGISGTTAEYLINACDEFMFYDRLVNGGHAPATRETGEQATVSFDLSEGRQLLRRVLQTHEGEWMLAAELKNAMLRLDPAFSERNYNYSSFKDFLNAQKDLVQTKIQNNQITVQLAPESETDKTQEPEALLEKYLKLLAKDKIRMTPNEYRPRVIFKFFELCKAHPELSLTQLKELVHAHFEEEAPLVKWQYIHETSHQLFHTYCFDFGNPKDYPDDVRLWDRRVGLGEGIKRREDMLDKCDRGLLQKLAKPLGGLNKVDKKVAARLLYGSFRGQKMFDHVGDLLDSLKG